MPEQQRVLEMYDIYKEAKRRGLLTKRQEIKLGNKLYEMAEGIKAGWEKEKLPPTPITAISMPQELIVTPEFTGTATEIEADKPDTLALKIVKTLWNLPQISKRGWADIYDKAEPIFQKVTGLTPDKQTTFWKTFMANLPRAAAETFTDYASGYIHPITLSAMGIGRTPIGKKVWQKVFQKFPALTKEIPWLTKTSIATKIKPGVPTRAMKPEEVRRTIAKAPREVKRTILQMLKEGESFAIIKGEKPMAGVMRKILGLSPVKPGVAIIEEAIIPARPMKLPLRPVPAREIPGAVRALMPPTAERLPIKVTPLPTPGVPVAPVPTEPLAIITEPPKPIITPELKAPAIVTKPPKPLMDRGIDILSKATPDKAKNIFMRFAKNYRTRIKKEYGLSPSKFYGETLKKWNELFADETKNMLQQEIGEVNPDKVSRLFMPSRWFYTLDDVWHKIAGKHLEIAFWKTADKLAPKFIKKAFVYGYGQPKEYLELKDMWRKELAGTNLNISDLQTDLLKLTPDELKQVKKVIDSGLLREKGVVPAGVSEKVYAMAQKVNDNFYDIGEKLVQLELITPEQFDKWASKFYPRYYMKYQNQAIRPTNIFKRKLDLSYAKPRKDLSEEMQEMLGVIDRSPYPVVKKLLTEQHDISLARMFKAIKQMPTLYSSTPVEGWPEVDKIGKYKFDGYLHPSIAEDIKGIVELPDKIEYMFETVWGLWKAGKLANPATIMRNMFTNWLYFADWNGVPPEDVLRWSEAINEYRKGLKGQEGTYRELVKRDVIGTEMMKEEIEGLLNDLSDNLSKSKSMFIAFPKTLVNWTHKIANLNTVGDQITRIAIYRENVDKLGPDRAAKLAKEGTLDYTKVTPFIDQLRRGKARGPLGKLGVVAAAPFISFQYLVLPQYIKSWFRRPFTHLKMNLIKTLISIYTAKKLGLSKEKIKKVQRFAKNRYGRKVLPFPIKWTGSKYGDMLSLLDMTYIDPMGNYTQALWEMDKQGLAGLARSLGMFSGPFVSTPAALITNRDFYFKKPIYNEHLDTPTQKYIKQLHFIFNQFIPTPMGYGAKRLTESILKRPTRWGAAEPIGSAVLSTMLGLKQIPFSEKIEAKRLLGKTNILQEEYYIERSGILGNAWLSDEGKQKRLAELNNRYNKAIINFQEQAKLLK